MKKNLDTSCKNCIFAQYKDITQIGCKYNRLDVFRRHNINIVECFDDDKEFYVIPDTQCHYKRTKKWKRYKKWLDKGIEEFDIRKEVEMKYQVLIYDDTTFNQLEQTIKSLIPQSIQPLHISILRYQNNISLSDTRDMIEKHLGKPTKTFNWKIINISNTNTEYKRYIDLALKSTHYPYYVVAHSGYEFEKDIFNKINNKIIDKCFKFSILDLDTNTYFVPYSIHSIFNGNHVYTLRDKIEHQWKDQKNGIYHISKI